MKLLSLAGGRALDFELRWRCDGGEMQKGTVKFFNDAKGFGFMAKPRTKTGHVTLLK